MSEIWDATYQAVRSKITNCNIESVVSDIIGGAFGNVDYKFQNAIDEITAFATLPHVLMRPSINRDGNLWCALYGDNLQEGVCGFGKSPDEACREFDKEWFKELEVA